MTYNISSIKLKKVDNFKFDIEELTYRFFRYFNRSTSIDVITEGEETTVYFFDGAEITGQLDGQWLELKKLGITGEFSGTIWNNVIVPSLPKTTGKLEAVLIWEGGDYIERVTIDNGECHNEQIR